MFDRSASDANAQTPTSDRLNPVQDSKLQYQKSLLLFFQLEKSLWKFVRSKERSETDSKKVRANLEELLERAERAVAGQAQENYVKKIKKLFELLEIKKTRNALAHPEKPFHPCYWYRIAALATDPAIEQLQLHEVTKTLFAVEEGKLISIEPIEFGWRIPNNLPEKFDHAVTGLIGRNRELSELKHLMTNKRVNLIAIVAPGGRGKTALLLQALHDIIQSPDSTDWADRILYFSSKTETLTAEGTIVKRTPLETLEGIRKAIASTLAQQDGLDALTFEEACQDFEQERILLCLDNLETLLLDDPKTFNQFNLSLPYTWRVVVTSRIDVNAAETIALNPLESQDSEKLAREYLLKRGGENLDGEAMQKLIETCNCIPLAIRLTIDRFIASNISLDECLASTNEQILEFSFKNLIETLSLEAREFLECLFATTPEPISRRKATFLLDRDPDDIARAFNQLRGTSLVTLAPDPTEESYILSNSVRELLVFSPIDTQIRARVEEKLRIAIAKREEIEKHRRERESNPLFNKFIPESAPDDIQVLVADAFSALNQKNPHSSFWREILKQIERALQDYHNEAVLHRARGMVRLKLEDRAEGIRSLQQAWDLNDIASGLVLSRELMRDRRYTKAKDITEHLVQGGWDNPEKSTNGLARLVVKNYCNSLIELGEIEQVCEYAQNWQDAPEEMRGIYGVMRVRALRNSVSEGYTLPQKVQGSLWEAINVLHQIFESVGYARDYVKEGMEVVKVLASRVRDEHKFTDKAKLEFVRFIDRHLREMCDVHDEYKLDRSEVKTWLQSLSTLDIEGETNPLKSERWKPIVDKPIKQIRIVDPETKETWIPVKVYYIPTPQQGNKRRPFLFAEDSSNQQYMVHRRNANSTLSGEWTKIEKGDLLEVVPYTSGDDGKAAKVKKARRAKN